MGVEYTNRGMPPLGQMRRFVVDKNMFSGEGFEEIKKYLTRSNQHYLVITDLLVRECMQGNAVDNFVSDFNRLVPFAEQLIALKTTHSISKLNARKEGLQKRLICRSQTNDLRKGLELTICNIKLGGATKKFQNFAHKSQLVFGELLSKTNEMRISLDNLMKKFPKDELKKIRHGQNVSPQFAEQLHAELIDFSISMFPKGMALPAMPQFLYSFPYRYAVAYLHLVIDLRLNDGGIVNASPEQILNDSLDLTYVTYGTFFDGIFSRDSRVLRVFRKTADEVNSFTSKVHQNR